VTAKKTLITDTEPCFQLDVQRATQANTPSDDAFFGWAQAALINKQNETELLLRLVDEDESAELNSTYRHKPGSTNVLSFPFEAPAGIDFTALGDLVICAPVVKREAQQQKKSEHAHWAHMLVHGMLHLQGHDHQDDDSASRMENLETQILAQLGFNNPYS